MKRFLLLFVLVICFSGTALGQCYQGDASVGYGIAPHMNSADNITMQTTHGYQFNPHFFLGAGIACIEYLGDLKNVCVIPVFLNAKVYFSKKRFSPYFSVDAGYGIDAQSALYLAPAFGVSWMFAQNFGCFAEVAWQSVEQRDREQNNMVIRIGFSF